MSRQLKKVVENAPLASEGVMTVYAVVDGLIPACIYGSLNFAGTINIPRIRQQWNKRPCSPRTGIEQEPIESSTVCFFVKRCGRASSSFLRSKSSLSMEAEVGNCAPFLPKIALVYFFFIAAASFL